jgi:hypothetical protein
MAEFIEQAESFLISLQMITWACQTTPGSKKPHERPQKNSEQVRQHHAF